MEKTMKATKLGFESRLYSAPRAEAIEMACSHSLLSASAVINENDVTFTIDNSHNEDGGGW